MTIACSFVAYKACETTTKQQRRREFVDRGVQLVDVARRRAQALDERSKRKQASQMRRLFVRFCLFR
jgi:hypothetical protein